MNSKLFSLLFVLVLVSVSIGLSVDKMVTTPTQTSTATGDIGFAYYSSCIRICVRGICYWKCWQCPRL